MLEISTNPAARRAFRKAHEERAQAVAYAWNWLFGARTFR